VFVCGSWQKLAQARSYVGLHVAVQHSMVTALRLGLLDVTLFDVATCACTVCSQAGSRNVCHQSACMRTYCHINPAWYARCAGSKADLACAPDSVSSRPRLQQAVAVSAAFE
jgi:hypothetical protein